MRTDQEIIERVVATAEAKTQHWSMRVHALQRNEFEALCRAGAEPIEQWRDGADETYCILVRYRCFVFFYGSSVSIEIPMPDETPT